MTEKKIKSVSEMTERERYEMLCRGEITMPMSLQKELRCRYVDRGIPFLKIAPFKEEEAYLEPRIVIYHDVIYDDEIETIKRMAQPRVCIYICYTEKNFFASLSFTIFASVVQEAIYSEVFTKFRTPSPYPSVKPLWYYITFVRYIDEKVYGTLRCTKKFISGKNFCSLITKKKRERKKGTFGLFYIRSICI